MTAEKTYRATIVILFVVGDDEKPDDILGEATNALINDAFDIESTTRPEVVDD